MRFLVLFIVYLVLVYMLLLLQNTTRIPFLSLGVSALSLALLTYIVELLRKMRK
jgi:hypothetical protein